MSEETNVYKIKFNNSKLETKTESTQLIIKPSVMEKGKRIAKANNISFNEMVSQLIEAIEE